MRLSAYGMHPWGARSHGQLPGSQPRSMLALAHTKHAGHRPHMRAECEFALDEPHARGTGLRVAAPRPAARTHCMRAMRTSASVVSHVDGRAYVWKKSDGRSARALGPCSSLLGPLLWTESSSKISKARAPTSGVEEAGVGVPSREETSSGLGPDESPPCTQHWITSDPMVGRCGLGASFQPHRYACCRKQLTS